MPLQFLRKNQKWILVIGGSLLVIAFLAPAGVSMFGGGGRQDQIVGNIDGDPVKFSDIQKAGFEIDLLDRVFGGLLGRLNPVVVRNDDKEMHWLLMLREAKTMGLKPSARQGQHLASGLGVDEKRMGQMAGGKENLPHAYIALSKWLILQEYRETILGLGHIPMPQRIAQLKTLQKMVSMDAMYRQMYAKKQITGWDYQRYQMSLQQAMRSLAGKVRISEPVMRRWVANSNTTVNIEGFNIPANWEMKNATAKPEVKKSLFEKYKDVPKGQGEKYGFGYRIPDQIKMETLSFQLAGPNGLKQLIVLADKVTSRDIEAFYSKNQETMFRRDPAVVAAEKKETGIENPYRSLAGDVWDEIDEILVTREATKLGIWAIGEAQKMIVNHAKQALVKTEGGYYQTDRKGWQPLPFVKVRDALVKKIARRLNLPQSGVVRANFSKSGASWLDAQAVTQTVGKAHRFRLGDRVVRDFAINPALALPVFQRQGYYHGLGKFALNIKDLLGLEKMKKTPFGALRLQKNMPSPPLVVFQGLDNIKTNLKPLSVMLFRVTQVLPSHQPAQMSLVEDALTQDAKRLDAYQRLKNRTSDLLAQFRGDNAAAVAKKWKLDVLKPVGFTRQARNKQGQLDIPTIQGFGQDKALVDQAFKLADYIFEQGGVEKVEEDGKTFVTPLDASQSLAFVRVTGVDRLTQKDYQQMIRSNGAATSVWGMMMSGAELTNPLSFEAVSKRMNYDQDSKKDKNKK